MNKTMQLLIILFSQLVFAQSPNEYLTDFLFKFSQNPSQTMSELPPKYDSELNRIEPTSKFSTSDTENLNFISLKDQQRKVLCSVAQPGTPCVPAFTVWSGFGYADDVSVFFDNQKIERSFQVLKDPSWVDARTAVEPWSGDYWATYQAGIASRYAHSKWPRSNKYEDFREFFNKHAKIDFDNQDEINTLSPAEKYDLLVQDNNFGLTQYSRNEAESTFVRDGKIETWFGLCHGWAPAAFMLARPEVPVALELENNKTLTFYPDDIKALATILWANSTIESHMMGGRCNDKNPKKDSNGRIISQDCFDMNPGSWHLAVLNQVGQYQQSFVIDATYDYEVWNQPVSSYSLTYFNPITQQQTNNPENAIVDINKHQNDIFKKYRSKNTKYLVGVSMNLTYVSEVNASHESLNTPNNDSLRTVQYIYDLELNAEGEIIGGEWYQNAHPDFIWTPYKDAHAVSVGDRQAKGDWTTNTLPPKQWSSAATLASSYGQPLAKVVNGLIKRSKKQ